MKNTSRIFLGLSLLSLSSLLGSCQQGSASDIENDKEIRFCLPENFIQESDIQEVKLAPIKESIQLTGKIESNSDKVIHFVSLFSGVVTKTNFSLGDQVKDGQLLAEILSPELSSLQAEQKSLEAEIEVAKRQLASTKSMFEDQIASEKDLLEASSELKSLQAELHRVEANLSLYKASPDRGVFQIFAPSSGVIISKNINAGTQIVSDDVPLFTIADLSTVWAMVNVYAGNLTEIHNGQKVSIQALSYPNEIYEGEISNLSQVFESDEKVLKARVKLDNPQLRLKPGMVVDVLAQKDNNNSALAVPEGALIFDDNEYKLVVYTSRCQLEVKKVELLSKNNQLAYLKSGLEAGESILTKNQLLVYEQLKNHAK